VDSIYVTVWDEDNNLDVSAIETIPVTVVANYNGDTEYLLLHETGVDTGIFRNIVRLGSTYAMDPTSGDNVIQTIANAVAPEEFITVDYIDPFDATDSNSTDADVIPVNRDDRDGDGIPNIFEDAYPGVLDSDDPGDAGQDFDGDGRINILEYQQGTDPSDPADNYPIANAGADQIVDPSIVYLDGSASSDPSTHTPSGIVSYQWSVISVPVGATVPAFSSPNVVNPYFVLRTAGDYEFELTVRDADGVVNTGYVNVEVNDVDPMAEIIQGSTINGADFAGFKMDARGSTDANRQVLAYSWGTSDSPPARNDDSSQTPAFISAPLAGVYEMDCDVIDPGANSDYGTQTVIVHRPDANVYVPTAYAGPDQSGTTGNPVTLDGTGSTDYDQPVAPLLNYQWTKISGPAMALSDIFSPNPTFTPVVPGIYIFSLEVDDGAISSALDYVTVTVNAPTNYVPVANAGDNGVGLAYITYTLDGSASVDSDGSALTYLWKQIRGDRTPLSDETAASPSFTPISAGLYEFELVVNDGLMDSSPDRVSVVIDGYAANGENRIPTANAGLDQVPTASNPLNYVILDSITGQAVIHLDGSNSYDSDTSDILTYVWRQTRGTSSTLSVNNSPAADLSTMTVKVPGIYEFELMVWDGKNFSNRDRVQIAVADPNNLPPVANAGADQNFFLNGVPVNVYLNGTGSYDPEGVPLTYMWSQTGGPSVSLSSNISSTPSFTANVAGVYTFALEVQDGQSPPIPGYDTVTVTVTATGNTIPQANAGPDQTNIYIDTLVTLNGSGSYDTDGDLFSYAWSQISGTSIVLSNRYIANPTFVPRVRDSYVFRLTVTGDEGTTSDTTTVFVIGGDTGDGGGTVNPPIGGGTVEGGGGGGCTIASGNPQMDPAFFLPLIVLLGFTLIRRALAGRISSCS
jgi:hypothetical protein